MTKPPRLATGKCRKTGEIRPLKNVRAPKPQHYFFEIVPPVAAIPPQERLHPQTAGNGPQRPRAHHQLFQAVPPQIIVGKTQGNRIHHGDGFAQQGLPGNAPLGICTLLSGIIQEGTAERPGRGGIPFKGQARLRPVLQGTGIVLLSVDKKPGRAFVRQIILDFPV